jgi:putative peptidoglycan lipid II flippase
LFGFGNATTANLLGWFSGVIVFQSIFFLITRVFYALQDTKTPLYTSIVAIGLNIILSVVLVGYYGVVGLPMAQSLAAALETLVLLVILKKRLGTVGGRSIVRGVSKMVLANLIMASVIYVLVARVLPLYAVDRGFHVVAPKFALICLAAGTAYLVPSYILGLHEAKRIIRKLGDKLGLPLNLT